MLSCSCGSALPLHLAAYIHPCAPALHVRHCLHPYPLYSWPPLQLSASAQRTANRGGKLSCDVVSVHVLQIATRKWHHSPSAVPSGTGGRPWQQPLLTTGKTASTEIIGDVWWLGQLLCRYTCLQYIEGICFVSASTAGWRGLHSSTQASGGSRACAGQEERAGLWEWRSAQWWLSVFSQITC